MWMYIGAGACLLIAILLILFEFSEHMDGVAFFWGVIFLIGSGVLLHFGNAYRHDQDDIRTRLKGQGFTVLKVDGIGHRAIIDRSGRRYDCEVKREEGAKWYIEEADDCKLIKEPKVDGLKPEGLE